MSMDDIDHAHEVITAYAEQLRELKKQLAKREKQVVMLRFKMKNADFYSTCPEWEREQFDAALSATDDLSGCILCDVEPRTYLYRHNSAFGDGAIWSHRPCHNGQDALESLPLYKARKV